MANTNYKPLWSGGSGCIYILTSSAEAPKPGDPTKIYIFKDLGEYRYWDSTTNNYIQMGLELKKDYKFLSKDQFPYIGEGGAIYTDQSTGKQYIWQNTGHIAVKCPNFTIATDQLGLDNRLTRYPYFSMDFTTGVGPDGKTYLYPYMRKVSNVGICWQTRQVFPSNPTKVEHVFIYQGQFRIQYYDPDNIDNMPAPDTNSIPSGGYYIIYFPKTSNLEEWPSNRLMALMQEESCNFAYLVEKTTGQYVQI